MNDPLYRAEILDHARASPYRGHLDRPDLSATRANPVCGDHVRLELALGSDGRILAVRFEGDGFALSQAGASMLAERIEGRPLAEAQRLTTEDMLGLLEGIYLTPIRVKCWLLAWHALQDALAAAARG